MNKDGAINLFKILGKKTNFLIIEALLEQDLCACKIPLVINRTQSNTSMHLTKLLNEGILTNKKEGKKIIYSLKDKNIKKLMELIK